MLSSITPLGERSRGSSWGVTVACFVVGSALAGTAIGWLLGLAGSVLLADASGQARLWALAALIAIGLALDLGLAGARLPTPRRQVNENWLGAYRGWVYGGAFGLQLGAGAATVVTTSAVYLTYAASLLSADPAAGALIGGAFGLVRGAAILPAWRVRTPERLFAFNRRLGEMAGPAARLAPVGVALAFVVAAVAAAGG
jgi:hypothetical protein